MCCYILDSYILVTAELTQYRFLFLFLFHSVSNVNDEKNFRLNILGPNRVASLGIVVYEMREGEPRLTGEDKVRGKGEILF